MYGITPLLSAASRQLAEKNDFDCTGHGTLTVWSEYCVQDEVFKAGTPAGSDSLSVFQKWFGKKNYPQTDHTMLITG